MLPNQKTRLKKLIAMCSASLLLGTGLSSCKPADNTPEVVTKEEVVTPARTEVIKKYKTVTEVIEDVEYIQHITYPEQGRVTMYPEETSELLNNPNSGIYVIENAPIETVSLGRINAWDDANAIAVLSSWGEIEKRENVYDWSTVDSAVKYWTSKGKRIVFRVSTDAMIISGLMRYSSEVPSYLFDTYGVEYETREMQGVFYRVPDYANAKFLERQKKFLQQFASRYKNNPYVEGVMLLGYGPWGEWHSGHSFDSYEQREETLAKIIQMWADAWGPDMPLYLSCTYEYDTTLYPAVANPSSFEKYKKWSAFDYAWNIPQVSFGRNGVGGALKTYDSRLLMESFYSGKRTPVQLELYAGYAEYSQLGGYASYNTESALQEVLMYRGNVMTVMGWDIFGAPRFFEERPDLVYKMNRYLGYRLMPKSLNYPAQIKPGSTFEISHTWVNDAVGRCPEDYNLTWYFVNSDGKTAYQYTDKAFTPSNMTYGNIYTNATNITVPKTLAAGEYTIQVALTDDAGKPAIELGITGNNGKKQYTVGRIRVSKQAKSLGSVYDEGYTSYKVHTVQNTTTVDAKLKAGKAYEVSFDYQTLSKDTKVSFSVSRKNGDKASAKAQNSWMDVSMRKSSKTYVVKLDNHSDYVLRFQTENGKVSISNIAVREVKAVFDEDFESDSLEEIALAFDEDASLTKDKQQILGGETSLKLVGTGVDSVDKAATYSEAVSFKPNTTYTVSFDYKTLSDAQQGAYMYMQLCSGDVVRGSYFWADLVSNGRRTQTFTFTTDERTDYEMFFGLHKALSVVIDNLVIIENDTAVRVRAKGQTYTPPQRNDEYETASFPFTANFEQGSLYKAGMLAGDMSFGEITRAQQAVVDGKYSVIGNSDGSVQWMNFLNTDTRKISFKPNTTYTISFDAKTVRKQHNEGGFMVYMRTGLGTFNDDRGYVMWDAYGNVKELGPDMKASDVNFSVDKNAAGRMELRVTTGNKQDYSLYFCIKYGGAFSVDNIRIEEGDKFVKKTVANPPVNQVRIPVYGFAESFEAGPVRQADGNGFFRRALVLGGDTGSKNYGFYSQFTNDPSKVINGFYSVWGENTSGTWYDFVKTNSARVPLYDGNSYYIRYKFKAGALQAGAHYAFTLKSDTHSQNNLYLWWNDKGEVVGTNLPALSYKITRQSGYYVVEMKATPAVGPCNYYMVWGMNGNGSISIDDICIAVNDPAYTASKLVTWETIVGKLLQ